MKNQNILSRQLIALRVPLCLCLLVMAANASATDVTFSATFQAPTCQVSAPASLDFDTVLSSDIRQGVSLANPLDLDIAVSQCVGFIGSQQKPGIKVTGTGNTTSGDFLFRLPTSKAVNYGVRIVTATGVLVADNSFLPLSLDSTSFDGGSTRIPLKASLSCGNKCNDAATKAGLLNATVTFDFAYQ